MTDVPDLTIALPSGKSLEERTLDIFERANITLLRSHPRACMAAVRGLPGITRACFVNPSSIPRLVAGKYVAFGITGNDTVFKFAPDSSRINAPSPSAIKVCARLAYSKSTAKPTRCVIFTHQSNPVDSVQQIEQNATVVTEYRLSTVALLLRYGIHAVFEECSGGAEAYVALGAFKYGAALVETGETLRVNGLKIIGTAFESSTVLIGNVELLKNKEVAEIASFSGALLTGVLDADEHVYLTMNAEKTKLGEVKNLLPSLKSPTVQPLSDPNFVSVAAVVGKDRVNELMFKLAKHGASGFVVLPPSSIV
jgi:ATP phosphoribosyltransferase